MPLSHEIAELRSEVRELRDDVQKLEREQDRAAMTLKALAEDLISEREQNRRNHTDLSQVISALSGAVKTLAENVAGMKPTFDEIVIEKHERAGAKKLLRRQWAIVAGAGAFVGWAIGQLVGWWPTLVSAIQSRGKP